MFLGLSATSCLCLFSQIFFLVRLCCICRSVPDLTFLYLSFVGCFLDVGFLLGKNRQRQEVELQNKTGNGQINNANREMRGTFETE